jgi:DNA-3-methyladenine glycosylase I
MVKVRRCDWVTDDELYVRYHDEEWGVPERGDQVLFERLVLEGMQAGLSWLTVLKKRERMRERFFGFDPERLARAGERNVASWLRDAGLIRHRGKLEAMIRNARVCRSAARPLSELIWSVVDRPVQNRWRSIAEVPATTAESTALAKALKQAGFVFVGPTTCYALMQSAGLVNDHLVSCFAHAQCARQARQ